eukprot:gene14644-31154_t
MTHHTNCRFRLNTWRMTLSLMFVLMNRLQLFLANDKIDLYPWQGSAAIRNKEIIESLKKKMFLDVYKETIPKALLTSEFIRLADSNGKNYSVYMKSNDNNLQDLSKAITSIRSLDKVLRNNCAIHLGPYWSYEWCYGKEVRQFHIHGEKIFEQLAEDGTRKRIVDDSNVGKRDPNWSLGKFDHQEFIRMGVNQTDDRAPIEFIVQYFNDGQLCDETGEGRTTAPPPMLLMDIVESPLCSYQINVCTPLLCQATSPVERSMVDIVTQLIAGP